MSTVNHQFRLAARPVGLPKRSDWTLTQEPVPEPGDDEFLVKILYISLDPAMRGWMSEGRSYIAPVGIGEVMRAGPSAKSSPRSGPASSSAIMPETASVCRYCMGLPLYDALVNSRYLNAEATLSAIDRSRGFRVSVALPTSTTPTVSPDGTVDAQHPRITLWFLASSSTVKTPLRVVSH